MVPRPLAAPTLAVEITRDLAISESQYGWLASAFSLAYLAATPAGGWWIDRAGARRGLVLSVLAWSAVAAMHGLAAGFLSLLALRIALGVAEGPSFPGSAQVVLRALPPAERARGFGVLFTGSSLGSMVVPPLAAGLYAIAGWRLACLGTADRSRLRSRVVPTPSEPTASRGVRSAPTASPGSPTRWTRWADLMFRVFGVEGFACPCGGTLVLHAVVLPPATLDVLDSLKRSARAPPGGTPLLLPPAHLPPPPPTLRP